MEGNQRKSEAREWGRKAEDLACEYLLKQGYVIRERNWSPRGSHLEVDIITQKGSSMVFVEVKARGPEGGDPAEAVDDKKRRRLVRAANTYLEMQEADFEYRFDIITVSGTESDFDLDHLEDAFLPPLTRY